MPSPTFIGFEHRVVIGLAELAVSNNPNAVLTTYSLGSCLGVAVYDPVAKVGGLMHAMLPDSNIDPVKAKAYPGMFVRHGAAGIVTRGLPDARRPAPVADLRRRGGANHG